MATAMAAAKALVVQQRQASCALLLSLAQGNSIAPQRRLRKETAMNPQPALAEQIVDWLNRAWDQALAWATSPAAWSQLALLVLSYVAARILTARLLPVLTTFLTPKAEATGVIPTARRFALKFLPLILPLLAYGLTAVGEGLTRAAFGRGEVIAFGKRVFLFLAARILVRDVLTTGFLHHLGRWVLIPVAALYALGVLDDVTLWLDGAQVRLGNIQFSVLALIRGAIAGAVLFWLGGWSNRQSADYIKSQDDLRPATRELAVKATEIVIFGAAFLLLMSIMGIDLTAVAVIGGALGVGIGLGLQQIAANFVSGIILLLEGQTTVGDFVELDGGEKGTIVKMTARACILETFDGKWIVVPNEHFITTRVVNYSDQGSANRYEAAFSVSYDTDINKVPGIIETAVAKLPFVLTAPDGPDCELRGFGESSVDFAVEYWVNGIDDGKNKYGSPVLFAIWNALKDEGIDMPFPQRVVHLKSDPAAKT
jgi:potassium efflux system protein